MTYFFTADQHFGHRNIIEYCNRPFDSLEEMDKELIARHNSVVSPKDRVVHAGDFCLKSKYATESYIKQLNGQHTFLKGSHDNWLGKYWPLQIWEKKIEGQYITVCHFAMRRWPKSHYGTWHLYGHSHGELPPEGKSWDVGVDNNDFYPVSFEQICEIMASRPDNAENHSKRE